MKMSHWMVLPLILGLSSMSVACGSPTPDVEESVEDEEMMEEEGMEEEGMEEEGTEEEEGTGEE
jgi:hypothetical protein